MSTDKNRATVSHCEAKTNKYLIQGPIKGCKSAEKRKIGKKKGQYKPPFGF